MVVNPARRFILCKIQFSYLCLYELFYPLSFFDLYVYLKAPVCVCARARARFYLLNTIHLYLDLCGEDVIKLSPLFLFFFLPLPIKAT